MTKKQDTIDPATTEFDRVQNQLDALRTAAVGEAPRGWATIDTSTEDEIEFNDGKVVLVIEGQTRLIDRAVFIHLIEAAKAMQTDMIENAHSPDGPVHQQCLDFCNLLIDTYPDTFNLNHGI